jgi:hypothetical protein
MDHIGIDVHKKDSQICILTEQGELLERRGRTESGWFAEVLGSRPRARILIESATESEWVARCLEALGHEVIVADPNICGFQKLWPWISGNSGPFPKGAPVQVRPFEMSRTIRRSAELDQASTFQDAVENCFGKIRVV